MTEPNFDIDPNDPISRVYLDQQPTSAVSQALLAIADLTGDVAVHMRQVDPPIFCCHPGAHLGLAYEAQSLEGAVGLALQATTRRLAERATAEAHDDIRADLATLHDSEVVVDGDGTIAVRPTE